MNFIDDETIETAREHKLDKKLIKKCERHMNSLEKRDVLYHRNLQTQVYSVSGYNNPTARTVNNSVIHYGDKPNETLENFKAFKQRLRTTYNLPKN